MICNLRSWKWLRLDFTLVVVIPKISAENCVNHFIRCKRSKGIYIISEIPLVPSKGFLHFNETSEGRFTQYPYVTSKQLFLCSWEFMSSGFIIAYIFSVNIHKNRIFFIIRKKELQGFFPDRGGRRKQNLWV